MTFKEFLDSIGRITSGYGPRDAPTPGASTYHYAYDIVLDDPTVKSFSGGKVIFAGNSGGYGYTVKIQSDDGYVHRYSHLAGSPAVKVGDTVSSGTILGQMGHTGISTGDHLDYGIYDPSGGHVDPSDYWDKIVKGLPSLTGSGAITGAEAGSTTAILENIFVMLLLIIVFSVGFVFFLRAFDVKIAIPNLPIKTGGKK